MITAIANQKGGVAKTTSTIALGGLLAEQGSCLVVDLDPQGNLTTGLGIELSDDQPTTYEALLGEATVKQAIVNAQFKKCSLSVLPADISLARAEKELLDLPTRFHALKHCLETVKNEFEHILIDCPPSMGLLTVNALTAANSLLIPVQCQFFALKGVQALLETSSTIQEKLNTELRVLGVLPTMAEPNTLMTQEILKTLKAQLSDIKIFNPVPKSVKFPESSFAGEPIHVYTNEWRVLQPYREVVKEMMLEEEALAEEE